jgi:hypothetical protein
MSTSFSLPTEPEGVIPALIERFNSGKVEAMMALYAPEAVFVAKDGRTITDRTEIAAQFQRDMSLGLPLRANVRHVFVGGDTGPMHFAAAVGTPIVSIFGPTSSDRNGPFRREDIVVERRLPCRPCYERDKCPLEHWQCIVDITVDQVYDACRKRLSLLDGVTA